MDTVSKQGEDDEIDGGPHARANTSLGADAIVHHLVPVLTRQDLQEKQASSSVTSSSPGQPPQICPRSREQRPCAADDPALQRLREMMLDAAENLVLFHLS